MQVFSFDFEFMEIIDLKNKQGEYLAAERYGAEAVLYWLGDKQSDDLDCVFNYVVEISDTIEKLEGEPYELWLKDIKRYKKNGLQIEYPDHYYLSTFTETIMSVWKALGGKPYVYTQWKADMDFLLSEEYEKNKESLNDNDPEKMFKYHYEFYKEWLQAHRPERFKELFG